jgi:hypothetical protein
VASAPSSAACSGLSSNVWSKDCLRRCVEPRSSAETSNMLDWDEQGTGDSCRILTDEGPRDDSRPALKTSRHPQLGTVQYGGR